MPATQHSDATCCGRCCPDRLDELVIAGYDTGSPALDRALDALGEVLVLTGEAEQAALLSGGPLAIPGWIAQVRDAIGRGLSCHGRPATGRAADA